MNAEEALQNCTADGTLVRLPEVQLERPDYMTLKRQLETIGGKWQGGKTQAFVFQEPAADLLADLQRRERILMGAPEFVWPPPAEDSRLYDGTAPDDAAAETAWGQIMSIARDHCLIVQAFSGVATLAVPCEQRKAGIRERVCRAHRMRDNP